MEIRKEIMEFAEEMERVMSKSDLTKGDSFKFMPHQELQNLMLKEVEETQDENAKIKKWIDIALFCMMIHHNTIHSKFKRVINS